MNGLPETADRSDSEPADGSDLLDLESGLEALQASPEFRGPVEPLDGHDSNDHLALVYESRDEQFAAAVPFVRQGLRRGERVLYIADENSREEVLAAMRSGGFDVDAAVESGALTIHTKQDTYCRDGEFVPDRMISFLSEAIDEARENYEALRVAGEMTWIFGDEPRMEDLVEYEGKLNRLMPEEDCIALCQYNRRRFPAEIIRDIVKTHPHLIYDDTVCQNFYYTPPEEFLGPDEPASEVDRMLRTLQERTEAKTALQEHERILRRLYEITADADLAFEEKVRRLLELGRDRFGLDIGFFARIDGDAFEVVDAVGDHPKIQPGSTDSLSGTYCRRVLGSTEPLGVTDARAEGWDEDPAYRAYGLDSYVGTTVTAGNETYGTLCFADRSPRDEPFSDDEYTFIELTSQWLSYELSRKDREEFLHAQNDIAASADRSFEDKLQALFELGCERFDLELGAMARVDPDADRFEIEYTSGDHEYFAPGVELPLSETYCTAAVDGGTVGVSDPRADGYEDIAVHREYGLQTYLGVHVEVDGARDRTFFFVSSEERDRPFSREELTVHRLMGQWVKYELERRQREERLSALNGLSRELMETETADDVCERVTDAAETAFEMPVTAVALWDDDDGALRLASATDAAADLLRTTSALQFGDSIGWNAFAENEPRRAVDPLGDRTADDGVRATELAALPLGNHGVLLVGSTDRGGFSGAEFDFVETVAANANAALDRAAREQQLHVREATLETQNEALERLDRINTIIRNIDQALVNASTRDEIAAVVCRQLADLGPYELAWIGSRDPATDEIRPEESAGAVKGYLDEITVTADRSPEGQGPAGRAIRTREPQVVNDVLDDPPFEPWRQAALNRGYHSTISLPLVYEDSLFGVLNVYAGQSGVFDDLERSVLAELSDTIAYAINAVENKRALLSDEVTELEFSLTDTDFGVLELVRETGCEFAHESTVLQSDGRLRGFFTVRGVPASTILESARCLPLTDLELVDEREEDGEQVNAFEAALTDDSIAAAVLEHGGRIREITATEAGARVVIDLASDRDVREFAEMFRTKYEGASLLAKRTRKRSDQTLAEFRSALTDDLTPRQLETLQIAHFSGYFETPRTRTGSDIAESMDISQPTFNGHLRTAQRKLFRKLFEREN